MSNEKDNELFLFTTKTIKMRMTETTWWRTIMTCGYLPGFLRKPFLTRLLRSLAFRYYGDQKAVLEIIRSLRTDQYLLRMNKPKDYAAFIHDLYVLTHDRRAPYQIYCDALDNYSGDVNNEGHFDIVLGLLDEHEQRNEQQAGRFKIRYYEDLKDKVYLMLGNRNFRRPHRRKERIGLLLWLYLRTSLGHFRENVLRMDYYTLLVDYPGGAININVLKKHDYERMQQHEENLSFYDCLAAIISLREREILELFYEEGKQDYQQTASTSYSDYFALCVIDNFVDKLAKRYINDHKP